MAIVRKEHGPGWLVRYGCDTVIGFEFFPEEGKPAEAKKKALKYAQEIDFCIPEMFHVNAYVEFGSDKK